MNLLVFDIETVPDTDFAKRIYEAQALDDVQVAELMFQRRRQETGGTDDFLPHYLHKVVAISVLLRTAEKLNVWSLGELDSPEAEIVRRFFDGIEKYTPMLVSWNGSGFDLPVLHYRSLRHGISAPKYWETGNNDQHFRWNNYLNRFHARHTDLMDVIAGYQPRANAPLTQIAGMLGLPGKMGMDGKQIWDSYLAGDIAGIRDYCEIDVLNTYLIFLRYELMRGDRSEDAYQTECKRLRDRLSEENKPHWVNFLKRWEQAASL